MLLEAEEVLLQIEDYWCHGARVIRTIVNLISEIAKLMGQVVILMYQAAKLISKVYLSKIT